MGMFDKLSPRARFGIGFVIFSLGVATSALAVYFLIAVVDFLRLLGTQPDSFFTNKVLYFLIVLTGALFAGFHYVVGVSWENISQGWRLMRAYGVYKKTGVWPDGG